MNTAILNFTSENESYSINDTCSVIKDINLLDYIELSKSADVAKAKIGDTITYTVSINYLACSKMIDVAVLTDQLTEDIEFITNTLTINGEITPFTPQSICLDLSPDSYTEIVYQCRRVS